MNIRNRRLRNAPDDINRDLGFGSLLGSAEQRLLNPDGSFNVERTGLGFWESINAYHTLITIPLWQFLVWLTLSFALLNVVFAFAYVVAGTNELLGVTDGTTSERLVQSFFFSVHTFSTIGYGNIVPNGTAANIVVTVESLVGLLWLALATGLLFSRFSKPNPRIKFSDNALVSPYRRMTAPHDMITGFMFRIANKQKNELVNVEVRVMLALFIDVDGSRTRRFYPLTLERKQVMLFPSSWTIVHPIDEDSPMYGLTRNDLVSAEAEYLIQLTGIDQTFYQSVHTWSSYRAEEVIVGAKFKSIYNDWQFNSNGKITIDISRLNEHDVVDLPTLEIAALDGVFEDGETPR